MGPLIPWKNDRAPGRTASKLVTSLDLREAAAMNATLHRFGHSQTPVVTLDSVLGDIVPLREIAAALAPFPKAINHFPGLRRVIETSDGMAFAYVDALLRRLRPIIAQAFAMPRFTLLQASFSIVTSPPAALAPLQRLPHFDTLDPGHLAIMHYLAPTAGTAFYRHRATGVEVVTPANVQAYFAHARAQAEAAEPGYIVATTADYEQIGAVEGRVDRLVIYPGNLLHSGLITGDTLLSDDPGSGRLTTNIFINRVA